MSVYFVGMISLVLFVSRKNADMTDVCVRILLQLLTDGPIDVIFLTVTGRIVMGLFGKTVPKTAGIIRLFLNA